LQLTSGALFPSISLLGVCNNAEQKLRQKILSCHVFISCQ
jgi:hypothetical protein